MRREFSQSMDMETDAQTLTARPCSALFFHAGRDEPNDADGIRQPHTPDGSSLPNPCLHPFPVDCACTERRRFRPSGNILGRGLDHDFWMLICAI